MKLKDLQRLVSAGIFSASMLAGTAYADNGAAAGGSSTPPDASQHSAVLEAHKCKGQNSCKGKGGCKAGDQSCKGKNSCKGKGGCATDGSKHKHHKEEAKPMAKNGCAAQNSCKGKGGCKTGDAGCAGKNSCKGKGGCAAK